MKKISKKLMTCLAVLCLTTAPQSVLAERSFVTAENITDKIIKVAVPGGKAKRLKPGDKDVRIDIDVTLDYGIEAKAWWVSNPRQLCVIFVRYEGHVVVGGDKDIRCLGH